jgi:hypothetical protein
LRLTKKVESAAQDRRRAEDSGGANGNGANGFPSCRQ